MGSYFTKPGSRYFQNNSTSSNYFQKNSIEDKISDLEYQLKEQGIDVPPQVQRSPLDRFLSAISVGNYSVMGGLTAEQKYFNANKYQFDEAYQDRLNALKTFDIKNIFKGIVGIDEYAQLQAQKTQEGYKGAWEGLKGANPFGQAYEEGRKTATNWFDELGWQNDESKPWYNPGNLARHATGFVADVALDPTTYMTFGAGSLLRGTGKTLGGKSARELAQTGITKVFDDLGSKGVVDELAKVGVNVTEDEIPDLIAKVKRDSKVFAPVTQNSLFGKRTDDALRKIGDLNPLSKPINSALAAIIDSGVGKQVGERLGKIFGGSSYIASKAARQDPLSYLKEYAGGKLYLNDVHAGYKKMQQNNIKNINDLFGDLPDDIRKDISDMMETKNVVERIKVPGEEIHTTKLSDKAKELFDGYLDKKKNIEDIIDAYKRNGVTDERLNVLEGYKQVMDGISASQTSMYSDLLSKATNLSKVFNNYEDASTFLNEVRHKNVGEIQKILEEAGIDSARAAAYEARSIADKVQENFGIKINKYFAGRKLVDKPVTIDAGRPFTDTEINGISKDKLEFIRSEGERIYNETKTPQYVKEQIIQLLKAYNVDWDTYKQYLGEYRAAKYAGQQKWQALQERGVKHLQQKEINDNMKAERRSLINRVVALYSNGKNYNQLYSTMSKKTDDELLTILKNEKGYGFEKPELDNIGQWQKETQDKAYFNNPKRKEYAGTMTDDVSTIPSRVTTHNGFWTREDVAKNKDAVYLFGDNIADARIGYVPSSTQAVIRGLDNAIGIPTKKDRAWYKTSFFQDTDADFALFKKGVDEAIDKAKASGKQIVLPSGGIGTGKAVAQGALTDANGRFRKYLNSKLKELENISDKSVVGNAADELDFDAQVAALRKERGFDEVKPLETQLKELDEKWFDLVSQYYFKQSDDLYKQMQEVENSRRALRNKINASATNAQPINAKPIIHSGGATGSDAAFGDIASELGIEVQHHSFAGHRTQGKGKRVEHSAQELAQANQALAKANQTLKRRFPTTNDFVNNLLRRNYYQLKDSDSVVAVGRLIDDSIVDGGTGWAVQMARDAKKTIYVFDQTRNKWFVSANGERFNAVDGTPVMNSKNFAGIGTRELQESGRQAIKDMLEKNFKQTNPFTDSSRPVKNEYFKNSEPVKKIDDAFSGKEEMDVFNVDGLEIYQPIDVRTDATVSSILEGAKNVGMKHKELARLLSTMKVWLTDIDGASEAITGAGKVVFGKNINNIKNYDNYVAKNIIPHEVGHHFGAQIKGLLFKDRAASDWVNAIKKDGKELFGNKKVINGSAVNYKLMHEDLAEAFKLFVNNPKAFQAAYPYRYSALKTSLENLKVKDKSINPALNVSGYKKPISAAQQYSNDKNMLMADKQDILNKINTMLLDDAKQKLDEISKITDNNFFNEEANKIFYELFPDEKIEEEVVETQYKEVNRMSFDDIVKKRLAKYDAATQKKIREIVDNVSQIYNDVYDEEVLGGVMNAERIATTYQPKIRQYMNDGGDPVIPDMLNKHSIERVDNRTIKEINDEIDKLWKDAGFDTENAWRRNLYDKYVKEQNRLNDALLKAGKSPQPIKSFEQAYNAEVLGPIRLEDDAMKLVLLRSAYSNRLLFTKRVYTHLVNNFGTIYDDITKVPSGVKLHSSSEDILDTLRLRVSKNVVNEEKYSTIMKNLQDNGANINDPEVLEHAKTFATQTVIDEEALNKLVGDLELPKEYIDALTTRHNESIMYKLKPITPISEKAFALLKNNNPRFTSFSVSDFLVDSINKAGLMQQSDMRGWFLKAFDFTQRLWKVSSTSANPGFGFSNWQSNQFNMFLNVGAEVLNPKTQLAGARLIIGKFDKSAQWNVGGKIYTDKEIYEIANRLGVVSGGLIADMGAKVDKSKGILDTGNTLKEMLNKKKQKKAGEILKDIVVNKANPLNADKNVWYKFWGNVNTKLENQSRMTLFLANLNKGSDFYEAADNVNKFLFDYHDLSEFEENVFKRLIPFYTWMRKNIPLQVEQLFNNPRPYAIYNKAKTNIENMTPEDERLDDREKNQFAMDWLQLPFSTIDKSGNSQPTFFNPRMPLNDLNKLTTNPIELGKTLLTSSTPFAKLPIELTMNKNLFFNNDISKGIGDTDDAPGYLQALLGGTKDSPAQMNPQLRYILKNIGSLENVSKMIDASGQTREGQPIPDKALAILKFMSGLSTYSYDAEKYKKWSMRDRLKMLRDIANKYNND